jgi:hypothetical protein
LNPPFAAQRPKPPPGSRPIKEPFSFCISKNPHSRIYSRRHVHRPVTATTNSLGKLAETQKPTPANLRISGNQKRLLQKPEAPMRLLFVLTERSGLPEQALSRRPLFDALVHFSKVLPDLMIRLPETLWGDTECVCVLSTRVWQKSQRLGSVAPGPL